MQLTVLSDGSIILPDGTHQNEKLVFKREKNPGTKGMPRGFILSVDDLNFWKLCSNCFSSIPAENLEKDPEVWFTEDHNHDMESIVFNKTTNKNDNMLVN